MKAAALLALVLLTSCSSTKDPAPAPDPGDQTKGTARLKGIVRDERGPIAGVAVIAVSMDADKATAVYVTGADGRYELEVPPGTWSLTFDLEGFEIVDRRDIQAKSGQATVINAEMKPADR